MMRRLTTTVALLAVLSGGATAAGSTKQSPRQPLAQTACTRATIGGRPKCIARGQFCTASYQRQYRRYGFSCVRVRGRYRLQ